MRRMTLLWAGAVAALAACETVRAAPVVAILDPDKLDRVGLLEAKLLADPSLSLVERSAVEKVLNERELQALFAAQGVGERAKLGATLKADVLVLVRSAKGAKEPAAELVVCETAGGLRLLARPVPLTADAAADAALLEGLVRTGLAKHATGARAVVAVPPFVSRDLLFDTDHLKAAFAKLAERTLADQPGVLAVELAEAEAIAEELRLAAPGAGVRRAAPLYLLGEYRHDGSGADRRVRLTLRAERAGKAEVEPMTFTVAAAEASAEVRNWAGALAALLGDGREAKVAADPKVEAAQLAERALAFRRLGDWPEALALAEASLLLDPNQPAMHAAAVKSLVAPAREAYNRVVSGDLGALQRFEQLYTRGLLHLEPVVASGEIAKHKEDGGGNLIYDLHWAATNWPRHSQEPPEVAARFTAIQEKERAMFERLVPFTANINEECWYVARAVDHLPLPEKYELLGRLVAALAGQPNARNRAVGYGLQGRGAPPHPDAAEYREFIRRLAASPDADLRSAAAGLDEIVAASRTAPLWKHSNIDPKTETTPGPERVRLTPVTLRVTRTSADDQQTPEFNGMMPAGPGIDVL